MGVTGSGKTTVGKLLAQRLGWLFLDADDFHPPENIEKMKHGVGFEYAELSQLTQLYDPAKLPQGWSRGADEEIYFIENPGLGLWASRDRF